jgi:two-component system sensor histidine kinase KdpD
VNRSSAIAWALWLVSLAVATALLLVVRPHLNEAHVALAYLVIVLGAGAWSGRAIGLTLAALAFICFDWFFVVPYGTLAVGKPVDWVVLFAFLAASVIVTQLFERVRREAEGARVARQRESIMASVSHDLRTPLTTIKALAHDLAAGGDERAEQIETEADRLTVLVTDLLDYSRVNSGSLPLAIEPNEAEDLIGAALQQITGAAGTRRINVELDPDHPLLFGRFDFTQTLRVLVNLLDNAIKYSPADAPIDLSGRRDGSWLAFSVLDRGPGIPDAAREAVFVPFYRRNTVSADTRGAGLGLSIARALAAAQGGRLEYAARAGGGSVFTLRVPAVEISESG